MKLHVCSVSSEPSLLVQKMKPKSHQGSYRQVKVKIKDFSRTSKDYPTVFKDFKFMKNPHLSIKILLSEMLD